MPEDVVVDAPVTLPASTTFEEYVAARTPADDGIVAAVVEPDLVADAPSPESGQTPEPTESAPVEESTTAVAAEPAAPEPAAEPVTVEETQEQKEQREKKQGSAQKRIDEITKARRAAEVERDAVKAENERLARELAEAKTAKPPEPAKPEPVAAAAETPKPAAPETPALEDFGGDWDAYQVGLKKFNRETYPAYVEQLADWKAEQRDIANKKKADETAAATRKQAEDAAKAETDKAEADSAKDWNSRFQAVKDAHPDFEQKLTTTPASAAMRQAILDMDDGPDLAHWLTEHQDEAKRIFDLTGTDKPLPAPQFRKAVLKAAKEFAKIDFESAPVMEPAEVAAAVAAPAATVVTSTPPALPVNPKPNTTKAPRPPSPVQERGAAAVKDPSKANSFEEYEAARLAARTATRR